MDRFKKILVPIDGKKGSYECLRLACHIAKKNNSKIHLVHVVNMSVVKKAAELSNRNSEEMIAQIRKQAEIYFKHFMEDIQVESDHNYNFQTKILQGRNVDEELINYGQNAGIDLIIISLSSKKHASDVIVGHITLRIVEFSQIPVLVLPIIKDLDWG